jgi:hypothetical protein
MDSRPIRLVRCDPPRAGVNVHENWHDQRARKLMLLWFVKQPGQVHAREEVIEGMGVTVVRVPVWRCLLEPDAVAQEVRWLAD